MGLESELGMSRAMLVIPLFKATVLTQLMSLRFKLCQLFY